MDPINEPAIRLALFLAVFTAVATLEWRWPRRPVAGTSQRWTANAVLALLGAAATRAVLPAGLMGVAVFAEDRQWGILGLLTESRLVSGVAAFVLLDFAVYLQHRAMHAVPALWRLHLVHHSDFDLDATTGVRFHPGEMLVSLGWKSAVVILLGAPPLAVLLFEIALNATSLFTHANLRLPGRAERWLQAIVVTPGMHRIHHSIHGDEQNSNFGFSLSWWDLLLRTYRTLRDEDVKAFGVAGWTPNELGPARLLALPWRRLSS